MAFMTRAGFAALSIVAFALLFASGAQAAELARRPVLGAAIAPLPDAARAAQNVPAGQGVLLANVLPGLSAEGAGLNTGDILLALDGKTITSAADVVAAVRVHKI